MQPGTELAGLLEDIDVGAVSPHDRVVVMRAHARMEAHHQARKYQAMGSVADALEEDHPQHGFDGAAAEIQAALCLTRRATESELGFALDLSRRLPQVLSALEAGAIDYRRAKTLTHNTGHLALGTAWEVVERVLDDAGRLTSGQLRARLERVAIEADPEAAQRRYDHSVADRRVVLEATGSGTANLLGLDLPPHRAAAVSRRINHLARQLNTKDEPRTMDQLRADAYLDLLLGDRAGKGTSRGSIDIQVPLDTLIEAADRPGEIAGYGPVVADVARQVAAEQQDAEWRYATSDPDTGHILHTGTTRRRPTAALRRRVQGRDRTCVFPGCRMPAIDCDFDHTRRVADGGETSEANGAPLCRHNHITKDQLGWRYRRLSDGRYQWTSRLGHTYITGVPP